MLNAAVNIVDWAACTMTAGAAARWQGLAAAAGEAPTGVPTLLRRRIGEIGQRALAVAYRLPSATHRTVFCSRHAEFDRTWRLLDAIVQGEAPSPAEFSLSVHHALAGLLSIARANTAPQSAVAAGADSFGFGLLEAVAQCLERPGEPVLLVYFDAKLPGPYAALEPAEQGVALALLLCAGGDGGIALETAATRGSGASRATTGQAMDFLDFLGGERTELASPGDRIDWRWRRAA